MLRKKVLALLALLAVAAVGLASPTIALAGGGGGFHGGPGGFYLGDFDGDPRFRIGWSYGLYPYDYDRDDYNYYDYPYAYNGSYVNNGSCYVVQRRARHARLAHATGSGVTHRC